MLLNGTDFRNNVHEIDIETFFTAADPHPVVHIIMPPPPRFRDRRTEGRTKTSYLVSELFESSS
jgi:hypothetical protein